ncbi:WYL domain-containing protein [Ectobacillus antri]|uniref:WYL domain-containing protein n=1 Tax=Ectobacillus antri TaxID=2486280 RepID=A0ABT6H9E2_9BACI|nr:WYL domain-containing protein [Ectobacillus antri]MDG4658195.1 WYL domain-containing protein [Ectobacillus antri]MDG5755285.1 WYL domain-containing protein [Ectobacillus antri]
MSKISNCLRMIELLHARGKMKISELAQELDVKERMVRNYKEDLEKAGIYVEGEKGRDGGYSLSQASFFPTRKLQESELSALIFAVQQLLAKEVAQAETAQVALDKLRAAQCKEQEQNRYIHFVQRSKPNRLQSGESKKYMQLQEALASRRKVQIVYRNSSSYKKRIICPYGFVYYNDFFYCAAFCESKQELRTFKVVRIEQVDVLQERYTIPATFDIRKEWPSLGIMRNEVLHVKLHISPPFSQSVPESIWGENQSVQYNDDGSILFEAVMKGRQSVKKWILSMGASVSVIEPIELKEEIIEEHMKVLRAYGIVVKET